MVFQHESVLSPLLLADRAASDPIASAFGPKISRKARRIAKCGRRIARNIVTGGSRDTRVIFIMGAQRSGTRVPLVVLESVPDILTYGEGSPPFFQGLTLRPDETIKGLIERCYFPFLALKPLCDSHRARHLLERFDNARVIWIFRGYEDTVSSASRKWSSGAAVVDSIVQGRLRADDWRNGGLTEEALEVVRRLYRPGLSLNHANAILWYLRNRLVLDQDLFNSPRALIVKYEDLSTDPMTHFGRVFDFIGEPLRPEYVRHVHGNSVCRKALADTPEPVIEVCEALFAEIDKRYRQQSTR